jgi:exosortase C (VPDSG-CTERM-specific)
LVGLFRFAFSSDLYSYIFLIPFVSIYLVWIGRRKVPPSTRPDYRSAILFLLAGAVSLLSWWALLSNGGEVADADSLSLSTLSFVLTIGGACALCLGRPALRAVAFPLGFLFLMVPYPVFLRHWAETVLQEGSAGFALILFKISGTPVFSRDLIIQLPDISLRVAPECSGIHSSLALFITSLLGGYLFLQSYWRRWVLTFAVIPLAFIRNGFRIYTIGELCVHIGPQMIDSYIHRHGGPVFFALSLVPFLLILFLLVRSDRVRPKANPVSIDS